MKLNEFIQQTLWEISSGVTAGAIRSRPFAAVAPATIDGEKVGQRAFIEFDIALVVSEGRTSKKSAGGNISGEISVAPFAKISLGAAGDAESEKAGTEEQTHRVSFKVPIYFEANFRNRSDLDGAERDFATRAIASDTPL